MRKRLMRLLFTLVLVAVALSALTPGHAHADDVHPYIVSSTTTCVDRRDCSGAFSWDDCTRTTLWSDGHTTTESYSTIGSYAMTPLIELEPCCCN